MDKNKINEELDKEEQEFLKRKAYIDKLNAENNVEELIKINEKLNEEIARKGLKTVSYNQIKKQKKDSKDGKN